MLVQSILLVTVLFTNQGTYGNVSVGQPGASIETCEQVGSQLDAKLIGQSIPLTGADGSEEKALVLDAQHVCLAMDQKGNV